MGNVSARSPLLDRELPPWLLGSFRREWIERKGVRSHALGVHYLQTPRMFADLRIPIARPILEGASLLEATDSDFRVLAEQKGFAGYATLAGDIVTWHHELDYQPEPPGEVDAGRVAAQGNALFEYALDDSYRELWWRTSGGDGKFLVAERRAAGRLEALWVVAGDAFIFARNRAKDLPAAASLAEIIHNPKADRQAIIAYLDCEISAGRIRGGATPWVIERSTLPWREGQTEPLPLFSDSGAIKPRAGWVVQTNTFASTDLEILCALGER